MQNHHWSKHDLDLQFGPFNKLSDLIKKVEDHFFHTNQVICQIEVNGLTFHEADEVKWAETSSEEIRELCIKTSELNDLLYEAIGSAKDYLKRLKEVSLKSADTFRTDDLIEAQKLFGVVIEGAQWVTDIINHIHVVMNGSEGSADQQKWNDVQTKFKSSIDELVNAVKSRDYILVADILEYDWTTALDQWSNLLLEIENQGQGQSENAVGEQEITQSTLGR